MKKERLLHLGLLALGLLLFGVFVYLGGADALFRLGALDPLAAAGAFAATGAITSVVAARWGALTDALAGRRVARWFDYHRYFLAGRLLGYVIPNAVGDFGARIVALNRSHDLRLASSGMSVVADRAFDGLVAAVLAAGSLPYWLGYLEMGPTLMLMAGAAVCLAAALYLSSRRLVPLLDRTLNGALRLLDRVPLVAGRGPEPIDLTAFGPAIVARAYLQSVLKFALVALRFVLIAVALGLPISPLLLVIGTPVAQLSMIFAFTPGGLGILEAGWFAVLAVAGVGVESASTFVVGQRILVLIFVGGVFVVGEGVSLLGGRRRRDVLGDAKGEVESRAFEGVEGSAGEVDGRAGIGLVLLYLWAAALICAFAWQSPLGERVSELLR